MLAVFATVTLVVIWFSLLLSTLLQREPAPDGDPIATPTVLDAFYTVVEDPCPGEKRRDRLYGSQTHRVKK